MIHSRLFLQEEKKEAITGECWSVFYAHADLFSLWAKRPKTSLPDIKLLNGVRVFQASPFTPLNRLLREISFAQEKGGKPQGNIIF